MVQYIDKSAVVAEIRKRLLPVVRDKHYDEWEEGQDSERKAILGILDTLEVKDFELTWEDVAWIVNKTILQCREESTLTAEDICKDVLKQFKAQKGE